MPLKTKCSLFYRAIGVKTANVAEKLAARTSFAMTHVFIASLSKREFSKRQGDVKVAMAEFTNGVGWIIRDPDLLVFDVGASKMFGEPLYVAESYSHRDAYR